MQGQGAGAEGESEDRKRLMHAQKISAKMTEANSALQSRIKSLEQVRERKLRTLGVAVRGGPLRGLRVGV
eukprot:179882-Rhodomonas_salina.1